MQPQEEATPSIGSMEIEGAPRSFRIEPTAAGHSLRRLFQIIFYVHLLLVSILVIFLTIRGDIFDGNTKRFHPKKWFSPLFVSTTIAGILSLIWQCVSFNYPSEAINTVFWATPLLIFSAGVLNILIGSPQSLATGISALVFGLFQYLYSYWVHYRFEYAINILHVSTSHPPARTHTFVMVSIIACMIYTFFLVTGIGGATAKGTGFDFLFIVIILLTFMWSMHVLKNLLIVTTSRAKYIRLASGVNMDTWISFRDVVKHLIGSVYIGSTLAPVTATLCGIARAIEVITAGNSNQYACVNSYFAFASPFMTSGNRWGFVHIGVFNKGFMQASADTWEMFRRTGLVPLIGSDLTGVFCFLSGVSIGSICSLVGGTWTFIIYGSYAIEFSFYAFLIGYYMSQIALAWQLACVSAYYVAYAENPRSIRFDATIPTRIEQLRRGEP